MFTILFILAIIGFYRLPDGDSLKRVCKVYVNVYLGIFFAVLLISLYIVFCL